MAKRKKREPRLEWMRAKKDETEVSVRRRFDSRCKRYYIQEAVPKFSGMNTVWYAVRVESNTIIGRLFVTGRTTAKRVRERIEEACEKDIDWWAGEVLRRQRLARWRDSMSKRKKEMQEVGGEDDETDIEVDDPRLAAEPAPTMIEDDET